jgi:hypothetical protein
VGRALRLHEGKGEALIIDLVGATQDHSLVSAPVLIGGDRCPESRDGVHAFEEVHNGKAECTACGTTRACFAAVAAGDKGQHLWLEDGTCAHCGQIQCERSPTQRHVWTPLPDRMRICLHCGMEMRDPRPKLTERGGPPLGNRDIVWLKPRGLTPPVVAVDCKSHGWVFVTKHPGGVRPWWVRHNGRKARPLTGGPVEQREARALISDILRQTERSPFRGSKRDHRYGAHSTTRGQDAARRRARERAVALGIAEEEDQP